MSASARVLLAPRMVVLHVVVLAVVLVLTQLGRWQLDRHGEASERADARSEVAAAPAIGVTAALGDVDLGDEEAVQARDWQRVTASGTYRPQDEVLQRGRSFAGRAGYDVLTPLDLPDGSTLVVRRGWVPFDNDLRPPVAEAAPPDGQVEVAGVLRPSVPQPTGGLSQRDPDEGRLEIVFHADLARLGPQLGGEVLPMVLHLQEQDPAQGGDLPQAQPLPPIDNGPHLNYAVQWFSFATIAAGMYALWLRRRVRGDERALAGDEDRVSPRGVGR